jgi:hypothetical protein
LSVESSTTTAEFSVSFSQTFRIKGVVVVPRFDEKTKVISGDRYISNTEILTNKGSCGFLADATHQPEIICDEIANELIIRRQCLVAPCPIAICSLGILTDCNCEETGFTE